MKSSEWKALISLLEDKDQEIKSHVITTLISLGEESNYWLEKEWKECQNLYLLSQIEYILHKIHFEKIKKNFTDWHKKLDLFEGLFFLSNYFYPSIKISQTQHAFHALCRKFVKETRHCISSQEKIRLLARFLFVKSGFSYCSYANANDWLLDSVLQNKRGNPILMGVLYYLIAKEVDLPLHNILKINDSLVLVFQLSNGTSLYSNAFNYGNFLSKPEVEQAVSLYTETSSTNENIFAKQILSNNLKGLLYCFEKNKNMLYVSEIQEFLKILSTQETKIEEKS